VLRIHTGITPRRIRITFPDPAFHDADPNPHFLMRIRTLICNTSLRFLSLRLQDEPPWPPFILGTDSDPCGSGSATLTGKGSTGSYL
jgi:hypothetical protein